MQLILTPAGGGQPVTLGLPGTTEQGALSVTTLEPDLLPTDMVLFVRGGQLFGAFVSALQIAVQGIALPSPFDMTAGENADPFLLLGVA